MLSAESRLPLYVQVKNHIVKAIDSQEYPVDSQLPTEKEFMEMFRVGRATVRAALSELEREGRITKRHGVGTFVAAPQHSFVFEPLISLNYSLERAGVPVKSLTIVNEITIPTGPLLEYWGSDDEIGHLKRLRMAGNNAIALEDSYYRMDLFESVRNLNRQESIAHAMLNHPNTNVGRIDLSITLREPTFDEQRQLALKETDRVAHMLRWMFNDNESKPNNFVSFVVDQKMLGMPFQFNNA